MALDILMQARRRAADAATRASPWAAATGGPFFLWQIKFLLQVYFYFYLFVLKTSNKGNFGAGEAQGGGRGYASVAMGSGHRWPSYVTETINEESASEVQVHAMT